MKNKQGLKRKALSRAELKYIYKRCIPNQFEIYYNYSERIEQLIKKVERKYEK